MLKKIFLTIFLFSYFVFSKSECDLNLFVEKNIVPDVIPDVPEKPLTVELSQKVISCGETLSTLSSLSLTEPNISYDADEDTYYTLIMLDADAPSPKAPLAGPFLHWFVTNIPGDDVDSGVEQRHYINPSPPPPDPHRYILTVFKQKEKLDDYKYLGPREKFDLADTQLELGLLKIEYGNYFNVSTKLDASDALEKTDISSI